MLNGNFNLKDLKYKWGLTFNGLQTRSPNFLTSHIAKACCLKKSKLQVNSFIAKELIEIKAPLFLRNVDDFTSLNQNFNFLFIKKF